MKEINKVEISGAIISDVKYITGLRKDASNYHIAQFDIAHERHIGKSSKQIYYFKCVAFADNAIALKEWRKGQKIIISGYLKYVTYTTKTGAKAHITQIVVEKFDSGWEELEPEPIEEEPTTSFESALKDAGLDGFEDPPF